VSAKFDNIKSRGPGRDRVVCSPNISTFLQLKQEANGWPNECEDDDDAKDTGIRGNKGYCFQQK